jgi:hypothetical protein
MLTRSSTPRAVPESLDMALELSGKSTHCSFPAEDGLFRYNEWAGYYFTTKTTTIGTWAASRAGDPGCYKGEISIPCGYALDIIA